MLALHKFMWALSTTSQARLLQSKWHCPYQAFMAGLFLDVKRGMFLEPQEVTKDMAILKYVLRSVVFRASYNESELSMEFIK